MCLLNKNVCNDGIDPLWCVMASTTRTLKVRLELWNSVTQEKGDRRIFVSIRIPNARLETHLQLLERSKIIDLRTWCNETLNKLVASSRSSATTTVGDNWHVRQNGLLISHATVIWEYADDGLDFDQLSASLCTVCSIYRTSRQEPTADDKLELKPAQMRHGRSSCSHE